LTTRLIDLALFRTLGDNDGMEIVVTDEMMIIKYACPLFFTMCPLFFTTVGTPGVEPGT
jgi:hypothetical protein